MKNFTQAFFTIKSKITSLGLMVFFAIMLLNSQASWSQLITEPFNYTASISTDLLSAKTSSAWGDVNSGDNILVTSGSLSYSGLATSTGNKIAFNGAGIDANRTFTTQNTAGTTVYMSFVLNVSSLGSLNTLGTYFTGLGFNSSTFYAIIHTRKSSVDATKYNIGIQTTTSSVISWLPSDYVVGTSYFIVSAYQIISGAGNDVAKIWVNTSSFGGSEPATTATAGTGTDATSISQIFLRQAAATTTPFIEMDEIRVGTTWASVTPAGGPTITIASLSAGIAPSPLEAGSTNKAVFGFSAVSSSGTPSLTAFNIGTSSTSVSKLTTIKLYSSTDNDYSTGVDNTEITGFTFNQTSSQLQFSGLSQTLSTSAKYYFIVANIDASVTGATGAVQPSLTNANVTVSSGTVTGGTLTGTNYSFALAPGTPTINTSGTLSAINTTYGTASAFTSFTVDGSNLTDNIVITPPTTEDQTAYKITLLPGILKVDPTVRAVPLPSAAVFQPANTKPERATVPAPRTVTVAPEA